MSKKMNKVRCIFAAKCDDMSCYHRRKHTIVRDPDCDEVNSCCAYIDCHGRLDGKKVRCVTAGGRASNE